MDSVEWNASVEPRPIAQFEKAYVRRQEGEGKSALHVLTLTPFFPSADDEVSGCFIAESTRALDEFGVTSSIIAVAPLHHRRKEPARRRQRIGLDTRKFPGILACRARDDGYTCAFWCRRSDSTERDRLMSSMRMRRCLVGTQRPYCRAVSGFHLSLRFMVWTCLTVAFSTAWPRDGGVKFLSMSIVRRAP